MVLNHQIGVRFPVPLPDSNPKPQSPRSKFQAPFWFALESAQLFLTTHAPRSRYSPRAIRDLWLFDVERKLPPRRLTSNPAFDGIGVWSPDGKQIVYASN